MVERFDQLGMASLFVPANETPRRGPSLSPALRQLIVDRKAEYPAFHLRELAQMCYVKEGRRPSPGTIQRVLADGPPPRRSGRRYPPYREMADPADARYAIDGRLRLRRGDLVAGTAGDSRVLVRRLQLSGSLGAPPAH